MKLTKFLVGLIDPSGSHGGGGGGAIGPIILSGGRGSGSGGGRVRDLSSTGDGVSAERLALRSLGLGLINVVLETGGEALCMLPRLVSVLRHDLCRYLLQTVRGRGSPRVLGLSLRVIFNLFNSIKVHLKIQLEVFLTSVHLAILAPPPSSSPSSSSASRGTPGGGGGGGAALAIAEEGNMMAPPAAYKEIALESLLEFCREPALLLDLYRNYDCDVRCTNLFEMLYRCVCRCAVPERPGERLHALHVLSTEAILEVLGSISRRCVPAVHATMPVKVLSKWESERQPNSTSLPPHSVAERQDEMERQEEDEEEKEGPRMADQPRQVGPTEGREAVVTENTVWSQHDASHSAFLPLDIQTTPVGPPQGRSNELIGSSVSSASSSSSHSRPHSIPLRLPSPPPAVCSLSPAPTTSTSSSSPPPSLSRASHHFRLQQAVGDALSVTRSLRHEHARTAAKLR